MHWMWEEWNTNFTQEIQVRRAATVMQPGAQPGGILTVNFQNLSSVPLNVDYKKEIEPYIGQKLGEGGFGKVYESTWRHQKVAIKVSHLLNSFPETQLVVSRVGGAEICELCIASCVVHCTASMCIRWRGTSIDMVAVQSYPNSTHSRAGATIHSWPRFTIAGS